MLTKVLGFIREFSIVLMLLGIGFIIYFGYQGLFGKNSAINEIKESTIRMEERQKLYQFQDKVIEEKMDNIKKDIDKSLQEVEANRQHIGTTARESYHPDMKRYASESIEEKIKSANDLFSSYGLSSK